MSTPCWRYEYFWENIFLVRKHMFLNARISFSSFDFKCIFMTYNDWLRRYVDFMLVTIFECRNFYRTFVANIDPATMTLISKWISKKSREGIKRPQWCWWQPYGGDLMMVTDLRCWWQMWVTDVGDAGTCGWCRNVFQIGPQSCHQHIPSPTFVTIIEMGNIVMFMLTPLYFGKMIVNSERCKCKFCNQLDCMLKICWRGSFHLFSFSVLFLKWFSLKIA